VKKFKGLLIFALFFIVCVNSNAQTNPKIYVDTVINNIQIGSLSNWSQVAAKASYSLALKTDGTLWAWGSNSSGQLGDGTLIAKSSPIQIGSLTNWESANYGPASSTSGALSG
jgi:alpha-tubulin suppressor-like RCC1 family protein